MRAIHLRSVCYSSARTPQPWRTQRQHRPHSPRLTWAPAAADAAGSPDDAQQQEQQQEQQEDQQALESDPELPANLSLDQSEVVPDAAASGSGPHVDNPSNIQNSSPPEPASTTEAPWGDSDRQAWWSEQAQLFALHQALQQQQQQDQQRQQQQQQSPAIELESSAGMPATVRSAEANAAARESYFADRAAAMQAQQARHDAYMASEQGQRLGRRRGFPWPLSAAVAAIQGVLQAVKAALALIPAVAASMRLKSLKQVLKRQAQAGLTSAPA